MNKEKILKKLREHLPEIQRRFGVVKIGLFGSWVRGDQLPKSDIDIFVVLGKPLGMEIVDLHEYLEQILGLKVDLVTRGAIERNELLKRSVEEELIYV